MIRGSKSYMAVTGAALIAAGLLLILKPGILMSWLAWLIGFFIAVSGISSLIVSRGDLKLSAILQVVVGVLCVKHSATAGAMLGTIVGLGILIIGLGYIFILYKSAQAERIMENNGTSYTSYDPNDNSIDEQ